MKTKPRCPHDRKQEDGGPDFGQPQNHLAEIEDKVRKILQLVERQRSKRVLARAKAIKGFGKKVLGMELAKMTDEELLKKMEAGEFDSHGRNFQHSPAPKGKDLAAMTDEELLAKIDRGDL